MAGDAGPRGSCSVCSCDSNSVIRSFSVLATPARVAFAAYAEHADATREAKRERR